MISKVWPAEKTQTHYGSNALEGPNATPGNEANTQPPMAIVQRTNWATRPRCSSISPRRRIDHTTSQIQTSPRQVGGRSKSSRKRWAHKNYLDYRPMLQVAAEGGCGQLLERNPCQATRFHFSCPTRQNSAVCTAPTIAPSAHSARFRGQPTGRGSSRRPSARANPTTNFFDPKGLPVAVCSRSNAESSASSAHPTPGATHPC